MNGNGTSGFRECGLQAQAVRAGGNKQKAHLQDVIYISVRSTSTRLSMKKDRFQLIMRIVPTENRLQKKIKKKWVEIHFAFCMGFTLGILFFELHVVVLTGVVPRRGESAAACSRAILCSEKYFDIVWQTKSKIMRRNTNEK